MDGLTWLRGEWDRFLGWGLVLAGGVLLVIGVVQVAASGYLADQLSFLMSAGFVGLGCLGFGTGLIISADLHDEWRKLDRLADILVASADDQSQARPVIALDAAPELMPDPFTTRQFAQQRAARNGG